VFQLERTGNEHTGPRFGTSFSKEDVRIASSAACGLQESKGRGRKDKHGQEARVDSTENDTGANFSDRVKENGPLHAD
jgi:hypothetical protein